MGFLDDAMNRQKKDTTPYQKPVDINTFISQAAQAQGGSQAPSRPVQPVDNTGLSSNPLRPETFDDYIGQADVKARFRKMINGCLRTGKTLHHVLISGPSGTGKTTLAHIIANEMNRNIAVLEAPVHKQKLIETVMELDDGDVLLIDEIHMQAKGQQAANSPETLYHVMEDRKVESEQGIHDVPDITVIGCTTDEGQLPPAFTNRFVIKPHLEEYDESEMQDIIQLNAKQLGVAVTKASSELFAKASLNNPRQVNQFMRIGQMLVDAYHESGITEMIAREVLKDEKVEPDGLTFVMMEYLRQLFLRRRWHKKDNEWVWKASLQTMAHAVDRGTDPKFVKDRIEPTLIKKNYIDIGPGGRTITPDGITRLGETVPPPPLDQTKKGKT